MAAIGFGVFVVVMLPAIAIVVVGVLVLSDAGSAGVGAGAVLIALGAILFAAGVVLSSALRQVFAVVLYRYTTSGRGDRRLHGRRPGARRARTRRADAGDGLSRNACVGSRVRATSPAMSRHAKPTSEHSAPRGAGRHAYWYWRFT